MSVDRKPLPIKKIAIGSLLLVALLVGGSWGAKKIDYGKSHVSTDDAYISGDLVNVSPVINGTLRELTIDEGDVVKKGQLIARLKDKAERAAVEQAKAAYQAALSQVAQAESSLQYERLASKASVEKALAAINVQSKRTQGAGRLVALTSRTVQSQILQAQSQLAAAEADANQSQSLVITAEAARENAKQGVETAKHSASVAEARQVAAQAEVTRIAKDEERYRSLLAQSAISQQQYDTIHAQLDSANAQYRAAQEGAEQARSMIEQARTTVTQTEAQIQSALKAAITAKQRVEIARSGLNLAKTGFGQIKVEQSALNTNQAQAGQATADLAQAVAGQEQITLRERQIETAKAHVAEAKAALVTAEVVEEHTYIYAPHDGVIVKKAVNVGAALAAGQVIATMTTGDGVWVTANYKETQLAGVKSGQLAEVEVDANPNKIFKARVDRIYPTTGATTTLLPPDNATGNFTKVVQRVPVRIELIPAEGASKEFANSEDFRDLRQGMSVTATIDLLSDAQAKKP